MMMLTPNFILIAVFVFFIHVHGGGVNPTKAFALISAFFILQNPMREFSEFLIKLGDGMRSIVRIQKFLLAEEIDTISNKYAVKITNGNFYWIKDKYEHILEEEESTLKGLKDSPSP